MGGGGGRVELMVPGTHKPIKKLHLGGPASPWGAGGDLEPGWGRNKAGTREARRLCAKISRRVV